MEEKKCSIAIIMVPTRKGLVRYNHQAVCLCGERSEVFMSAGMAADWCHEHKNPEKEIKVA